MKPKGIENAEAIISACRQTIAALGSSSELSSSAETGWIEVLESVDKALEELKTKFFLKTNLAIPITNACRRDAKELEDLAGRGDLECFPEVLERFRTNATKLLKNAQMDGITLT